MNIITINPDKVTPKQPDRLVERAAHYPKADEALDAIFDAMRDGILPRIDPWYGLCEAVKEAYPKQ
jgi:hypothetical protein